MSSSFGPNISGAVDLSQLAHKTSTAKPADHTQSTTNPYAVTTEDFAQKVIARSEEKLYLVDLGSPQKPDSHELTQTLTTLTNHSHGAWGLAVVDVQQSPQIAAAFQIQAIPTVIALYAGRPVAAFQGAQEESALLSWIQSIAEKLSLNVGAPDEHPQLAVVDQALAQGDLAAAQAAINQVLADEPLNDTAAQLAKHIEFLTRVAQIDTDIVERAQTHPEDTSAQIQAADFLLSQGEAEAAFNLLIAGIMSRKAEKTEAPLKEHLFNLFTLCGEQDPLVKKARTQLANSLF